MSARDVLLSPGEAETFKGGVHLCLLALTAMCLGYNTMAWSERRERHLAVNIGVYGSLIWFESQQLRRHLRSGR